MKQIETVGFENSKGFVYDNALWDKIPAGGYAFWSMEWSIDWVRDFVSKELKE